jgi:hypothetical protein
MHGVQLFSLDTQICFYMHNVGSKKKSIPGSRKMFTV